jgi:hypothetical protein
LKIKDIVKSSREGKLVGIGNRVLDLQVGKFLEIYCTAM